MLKFKFTCVPTLAAVGLLMLMTSGPVTADYDPEQGGWTEVIGCPTSSWDVCPFYHPQFYWGGTGPNLSYVSPAGWWTYASPGEDANDCGQWINGGIVGGATYEPGEPSIPQGVNVSISTNWWDFTNPETCGHQHATTYVWGWRYNGHSWSFEFVNAHQRTSYLDEDGNCLFQAAGNPDYPPALEEFAFGPETLTINNSPYAVLFTKTQAKSHIGADCDQFECFHRVRVAASYTGGPGPNEPKVAVDLPTNELTVESRPVVKPDPSTNRLTGTLSLGADALLQPTPGEVLRARSQQRSSE